MGNRVFIALGANKGGVWGSPLECLKKSVHVLADCGIRVEKRSVWYKTEPLGGKDQSSYINGVIETETHLPPSALLALLKQTERKAGRRGGRRWGPRELDLDIIDYKGVVRGWDWQHLNCRKTVQGSLYLPHPEIHNRPFVLKPLSDIAPKWRHPVLRETALDISKRLDKFIPGQVLEPVE